MQITKLIIFESIEKDVKHEYDLGIVTSRFDRKVKNIKLIKEIFKDNRIKFILWDY